MTGEDDDKTRLERLLEAGVYAPVGFLVTRSKTVPDLAKAGRKQIAFAQSLGRAALKTLARSAKRDAGATPTRSRYTEPPAAVSQDTPVESAVEESPGVTEAVPQAAEVEPTQQAATSGATAGEATVAPPQATADAEIDDDVEIENYDEIEDDVEIENDAEIENYDELTAREIIELVRAGDVERARWIHDRETAGKGRVTVLRAAQREID